ncbi:N-acetylmuramoyl-L-alanine amidase [Novosphingobium panipatense]
MDGPADASRPLVVIDPGHGGFDPGAGQGVLKEKTVALQIALKLRDALLAGGAARRADQGHGSLHRARGSARHCTAPERRPLHLHSRG